MRNWKDGDVIHNPGGFQEISAFWRKIKNARERVLNEGHARDGATITSSGKNVWGTKKERLSQCWPVLEDFMEDMGQIHPGKRNGV